MPDAARSDRISLRLGLEPVDTLFFRDGRPFEDASRAASGLPMPQTLAGAIRTATIEAHGVDPARIGAHVREGASLAEALAACDQALAGLAETVVRGPWFQRDGAVLTAAPANLKRDKGNGELLRLDPLGTPLPGWSPPEAGMLPLWRRGRESVAAFKGYLTERGLQRYLEGGTPEMSDAVKEADVFGFEDRTGISVDSGAGVAREGFIYGIRMLSLRPDVRILCEVSGPRDALAPWLEDVRLVRLGGEGRQVRVHAEEGAHAWPRVPPDSGSGRLVLLTTPGPFGGWRPPGLRPVAASVPGSLGVSGWDLARGGPKPNRFMVPAGAVYFLAPGEGPPPEGLAAAEDAQAGWGDFALGKWNHA